MAKTSPKYAPGARPAVERGIPVKLVDALIDTLAIDEEQITADAQLSDDLGADSLDLVEIQMALEKAYHVRIEDEILDMVTVKDVIDFMRKQGVDLG